MSANPHDATSTRYLGPREVRDAAARHGIRPTKTLGQNFIHDGATIRKIVAGAGIQPCERVLEVGPGLGSLTLGLVDAGASVVVVEIDETLIAPLRAHLGAAPVDIVPGDGLRVLPGDLPGEPPTALVANLPYNTAVPIVLHVLANFPTVQRGLVMVQAEVADRMAAPPGSKVYGVPSAKIAWHAEARRAGNISRNVFWPVPNVDSALVEFRRHPGATSTSTDRDLVFRVVDAAFAQRRKTLRQSLAPLFGSPVTAEAAVRAVGLNPAVRGETLTIQDFARLAAELR